MYVQSHTPDTTLLLANLAASIKEQQEQVDECLQRDDQSPDKFWERLGIRHIMFNNSIGRTALQDQWPIATDTVSQWGHMRNDACIDKLKTCFSDCAVIQFEDYVNVENAAGFWNGLFADVIKMLGKRNFEFIFQLGDVTGKTVAEVDEILDVIGDFSLHGSVSMVMDELEANKLWELLCGVNYEPPPIEKYQLQFKTMRVDSLLIFYNTGVMLLTKEGQYDFPGRPLTDLHALPHSREFFLTGYRLGLWLHLDIPHAIELGLVISGAYRTSTSKLTSQALLTYIDEWMSNM